MGLKSRLKDRGRIARHQFQSAGHRGLMLIRLFGDFNPARKKRTSPPADTVTGIEYGEGQGLLIRQALMPAQPELFLTAQAVDIAGFGEVGGGGFQFSFGTKGEAILSTNPFSCHLRIKPQRSSPHLSYGRCFVARLGFAFLAKHNREQAWAYHRQSDGKALS